MMSMKLAFMQKRKGMLKIFGSSYFQWRDIGKLSW